MHERLNRRDRRDVLKGLAGIAATAASGIEAHAAAPADAKLDDPSLDSAAVLTSKLESITKDLEAAFKKGDRERVLRLQEELRQQLEKAQHLINRLQK